MRLVYWRAPTVLGRTAVRRFLFQHSFRRKIGVVVHGKAYRQPLPDCDLAISVLWVYGGRKRSASLLLSAGLPLVLRPSVDVDRSGEDWGVTFLWLLGCVAFMWSTVDGAKGVAAAQNARLEAEVQP